MPAPRFVGMESRLALFESMSKGNGNMEKEAAVRVETHTDKCAAYAVLERLLEGSDSARRRALLELLLAATK